MPTGTFSRSLLKVQKESWHNQHRRHHAF